MFMIGAFLGWQASLICFFLAPFTSVGIAGAQWLITGQRQIAFGPFLCAGTTIVVLCWADIWQAWGNLFQGQMAILLACTVVVCVLLMGHSASNASASKTAARVRQLTLSSHRRTSIFPPEF